MVIFYNSLGKIFGAVYLGNQASASALKTGGPGSSQAQC